MPQALLAIIPAIVSGIGLVTQLAGIGQPKMPSPIQPTFPPPGPSALDQKNVVAAMQNALPTLQEQLGGALAPEALVNMAGIASGNPGQSNLGQIALNNWLGLSDTSSLFSGAGGAGGGTAGGQPTTTGADTGAATRGPGSGLSMFPFEAVPAYQGLSGGSV